MNDVLSLSTDLPPVDKAFRIALGDVFGNIQPWQGALRHRPELCVLAGLDYDRPWTRDASLNAWYAGSLLSPAITQNTLRAVLTQDQWGLRIGGQYWDAIIWVTAAWHHYLCTGDRAFLSEAFEVTTNAIHFFEATEFDARDGLFRGGACFQDGVAAYPDRFADGPTSGIADWVTQHPEDKVPTGYGLPMKALSTNCLYYNAYRCLSEMARDLDLPVDPAWESKAQRLKAAINEKFWNPDLGTYRYLLDAGDDAERQEGFGHAFAILFGVADAAQRRSILAHQHITPHGIPCVWPTYDRYANAAGTSFGRHSGTIWPQVSAAWAIAVSRCGRRDLAWSELTLLAKKACRDVQFAEIYHPLTGEIYGGLQEQPAESSRPVLWAACRRQTWSATGYIQMVLSTLLGCEIERSGITFAPYLPAEMARLSLSGVRYRAATLTVAVERSDRGPYVTVNGASQASAFIPADATGPQHITIGWSM